MPVNGQLFVSVGFGRFSILIVLDDSWDKLLNFPKPKNAPNYQSSGLFLLLEGLSLYSHVC